MQIAVEKQAVLPIELVEVRRNGKNLRLPGLKGVFVVAVEVLVQGIHPVVAVEDAVSSAPTK